MNKEELKQKRIDLLLLSVAVVSLLASLVAYMAHNIVICIALIFVALVASNTYWRDP